MDIYEFVGKRIKSIRKDSNKTIKELAEISKISPNYWQKIEAGEICFRILILKKICIALQIQPSFLFENYHQSERKD